jgi:hypothetical protein
MPAIAGNFHFIACIFATLAAIFLTTVDHAAACRMRAFFFFCTHRLSSSSRLTQQD